MSNYEVTNGETYNKAQGLPILQDDARHAENFHTKKLIGNTDPQPPPVAITFPPDAYTPEYRVEHEKWRKANPKGINPPDKTGKVVVHRDKPSTMDLCMGFLEAVEDGVFEMVPDDATIAKTQDPAFLEDLEGDLPIDAIGGESLVGTILHEVRRRAPS